MERTSWTAQLAELQSICIAAGEDKVARASVWEKVASALADVPLTEAEARCPKLRRLLSKDSAAYKTLTNSVSAAIRAVRCGVSLHNNYGGVIGRTELENLCRIAERDR